MRSNFQRPLVLILFLAAALAGCSTSGGKAPGSERFSNLLVIGTAGSLNSRAAFERVVVSGLRAEGIDAQRYSLIGGGKLPTRDDVLAVIDEREFDAVVITRVVDASSDVETRSVVTGTKVSRKDSGFMKLFRYDYAELGDPVELTTKTRVSFATELYSAVSHELAWSAETKALQSDNVAALIDDSAKLVVRELRRSGKLAPR